MAPPARSFVFAVVTSRGGAPTCHTLARCPAAVPPGADGKPRNVERLTADEALELAASRALVRVPRDQLHTFSQCSFCSRGRSGGGGGGRATVEGALRRLHVPLERLSVQESAPSPLAWQALPEDLVQALFMRHLTSPERLGHAFCPLDPCRDRVPTLIDAIAGDRATQLLFHKPEGGVEADPELRLMLLLLFYAARPRLGTPPALSRRAADLFVRIKTSPPADKEAALAEVAAAVAFMPPLYLTYGVIDSEEDENRDELRDALRVRPELLMGRNRKMSRANFTKEAMSMCLEELAGEKRGELGDGNPAFLAALRRLELRDPSHAAAARFYFDSVAGRMSVKGEGDEEVARLEGVLLERIAGRLDRYAREDPGAADVAYDGLLSAVLAMFKDYGDGRGPRDAREAGNAVARAASDRVPCLMASIHEFREEHLAADRALLADKALADA
jgi:hypothetical protein